MWYYYVCANGRRLRGSTESRDRGAAQLFADTLAFTLKRKSPRDRLLKLIDALFEKEQPPDIPLDAVAGECERIGAAASSSTSPVLPMEAASSSKVILCSLNSRSFFENSSAPIPADFAASAMAS